ncbi:MAG: hypothetical protein LH613_11990 [Chamaesiphon sp.]|nr:hypothetical protein [Chamaesiphon sp.]
MRDVIAKDLYDAQQSAHAQAIDLQRGKEAATQIGVLLLTASLSTAVSAVKGLNREKMVECLVSPLREPSDFLAAFEELEKIAWYVHHTPEGRYYFDRQENGRRIRMMRGGLMSPIDIPNRRECRGCHRKDWKRSRRAGLPSNLTPEERPLRHLRWITRLDRRRLDRKYRKTRGHGLTPAQ